MNIPYLPEPLIKVDIPHIEGEPVRLFMIRYLILTGEILPSKIRLKTDFPEYQEVSLSNGDDHRSATNWVKVHMNHDDWYNVNIHFFFSNMTQASIFKLIFG